MKANELMIGDWVSIYDPDDEKNTADAYQVSHIMKSGIMTDTFSDVYEEGWFKPIPLTEEILKINGFTDKEYVFYDGYNFELHNGVKDSVNVGALWFVHELQHALRLCGLNDLADNFKIE